MRKRRLLLIASLLLFYAKGISCVRNITTPSCRPLLLFVTKKRKGRTKRNYKMDDNKEAIIAMGSQNLIRNGSSNVYLSLNNYAGNFSDDYSNGTMKESNANTKLVRSNVLSIFSYTLKYMNKKRLNKWLRNNIKAPFYDTFVPRNKPLAYIRFKCQEDLKVFEKMIENKRIYPNDSLSVIKINKFSKYAQKRKFLQENQPDGKDNDGHKVDDDHSGGEDYRGDNNSSEKRAKRQRMDKSAEDNMKREVETEDELPDLQTVIKMNKAQKSKSIENFVTPFYKYPYEDQIKIKHQFLQKCRDQILTNLRNKWEKQSILFGDMEADLPDDELHMGSTGEASTGGSASAGAPSNMHGGNPTSSNNSEKKNKKNETSRDSCFNKTVLCDVKPSGSISREFSVDKKMKNYEFEVDGPLFPDERGINGYRNKCEFTISYDENNNVEIGFVTGKMKTDVNDTGEDKNGTDDNNCNFSEHNISNSASPINESQSTKLRNKKQKQAYYLNPIVKSVDNCVHIHACMKEVVQEMKSIIKDSNYPVFDRVYKTGVWRILVVRFNSRKELMITVQTYSLDQKKKKEIKKLLINRLTKKKDEACMSFADYKVVSLYLQEHENSNDSTSQSPNEHLWGMEYLEEIILNNRFLLTPSCFFQVNHTSCEILYKKVIDYINISEKKKNYIFDLCCGTGTISICAANELKGKDVHIVGIDICEDSIICANKNAEMNKIKNYKFIQGRVEELFANEIKNVSEKNSNVIIIVDPPRSGLANSVLNILSSNQLIGQIIYVSCNPITLISNVTHVLFQNENLRMKNLVFVDMFPHTFHLECITNIVKG
ncbi:RNA (uracil-5-)methyltransferase, putative [Plasmodium knowlesi strain H]|uniref:RNA (Uracil-5-)methyltransferase, putative n=3 Tax=Plasmodium knowlesi TaxID=5850 RepID=A0A5K1U8U2_PLAKH|nr:RNA (uracil-5-)methyltransferase, putative [Plasmodium knowlesi strain H]OTN65185.1 putative RNA (Uracil-5-)methyltransferase [Plasmodium knowlesi]CAA9988363.1 RNA (uracil-5-)methyltransferase, putative [Plasmodium knowlesi strain H]SBO20036.1 RNA (uracil-5-)methyltransferase, putative [Plasmodium knowlesi strain H]SBO20323.1 RNA (uracil-5-)methyltransferase, putative [Plasmodium knowlesi strain H]VVS77837.1 RNA (uracil-5-)methyltransferase, putative [Plasmodium knowlesi strain H]|eukprot:XP_002259343.1 hypothetical protein, conserved in Plasmodium species [Plasmodium knowlesi strain H]